MDGRTFSWARRLSAWGLLLLGACGPSGSPFVEMSWQLRCVDGLAGCPFPGTAHDVAAFDGEDGMTAQCAITNGGADQRVVNIGVQDGGDMIRLRNVFVNREGVVTACDVGLWDQETRYEAEEEQCGADGQVCRIGRVTIDGASVEGTLQCSRLTAPVAPTTFVRDLVSGVHPTEPVHFRLERCGGDDVLASFRF